MTETARNPKESQKERATPELQLVVAPEYKPRVAIVVPAYNEERNIENVLLEITRLRKAEPGWEIIPIVVNDGSTDLTEIVLNRISALYHAKVVNLPLNLGIGGAVQAGFRFAVQLGADVVLQLDGDGQHPATEIPLIVRPLIESRADVIVGSRYVPGASGNVSTSLRQMGTLFFSYLLKFLVGVKINDATSGFRAFSHEAADFIARYYPDDYPEVQTFVLLARRKFSVAEVPVNMRPRAGGTSSITPIRSVYYMIKVAFASIIDVIRPLPARRKLSERDHPRSAIPGDGHGG